MKRAVSIAIAGWTGLAMLCLVGCSTTHRVTETTTTKEYDAPNIPPVSPLTSANTTTTTTHYDNGTVQQRTVTQPSSSLPSQSTTTVTTDTDNGNVQKRTTTTY
jgi:hypothetical protein